MTNVSTADKMTPTRPHIYWMHFREDNNKRNIVWGIQQLLPENNNEKIKLYYTRYTSLLTFK